MDLIVFRPLERRSAGTAEKLVANLGVLILLLGIGGVIYGENTLPAEERLLCGAGVPVRQRRTRGIGVVEPSSATSA